MAERPYASLAEMLNWAQGVMCRPPDVVIGGDYLRRWHVIPRNSAGNVYLHQFGRSDDDRALHDHPWDSTSVLLDGCYREHTPDGVFLREPGTCVTRKAEAFHRIELIDGAPVVSLFLTGSKVRDWGFAAPGGWVPWQEFCATGEVQAR